MALTTDKIEGVDDQKEYVEDVEDIQNLEDVQDLVVVQDFEDDRGLEDVLNSIEDGNVDVVDVLQNVEELYGLRDGAANVKIDLV